MPPLGAVTTSSSLACTSRGARSLPGLLVRTRQITTVMMKARMPVLAAMVRGRTQQQRRHRHCRVIRTLLLVAASVVLLRTMHQLQQGAREWEVALGATMGRRMPRLMVRARQDPAPRAALVLSQPPPSVLIVIPLAAAKAVWQLLATLAGIGVVVVV